MPTPVRTLVVQDVQQALQAIGGAPDYNCDLSIGERVFLYGKHPVELPDLPAIVIWQTGETYTAEETVGVHYRQLRLRLICVIREGDLVERPDALSDFLHDVEKALMRDWTRSGYATDTVLMENETDLESADGEVLTFAVDVLVSYRTGVLDPSTTAPTDRIRP